MSETFPKMVSVVPEGRQGVAAIEHFDVSDHDSTMSSFGSNGHNRVFPGRYARLLVNGGLMMSDTHFEHRTNITALVKARGDVLIAGLGLGMILHAICRREGVKSVTVIEKYRDVIDLVSPTLTDYPAVRVIEGDIFDWRPSRGTKYDTIYFDIWPDVCTDNLEQIARLHQAFKSYKAPGAWMGSWCHEELKYRRQQERRAGW